MTLEERIRLIKVLDTLLKRKMKGNSNDYASKLGISRSAFFRLIDYVRLEFNAPLIYNKVENRYEYEKAGMMVFGFLPADELSMETLKRINGGNSIKKDYFLFMIK